VRSIRLPFAIKSLVSSALPTIGLVLATGLAWQGACAQGSVRGVVHDATRSASAVLAGAEVYLLGGSLLATTDTAGAFELRNLPFGRHTIVVLHARLDSLGLDGLAATVDLDSARPSATIALSTPSASGLHQRACARTPSADEALLMGSAGTLDGRAIAGATITVHWMEAQLRPGEMTTSPHTITATTDEHGAYQICGLPRSLGARTDSSGWTTVVHELQLSAQGAGMSSGALIVFPNEESIQRFDLVLGDDNAPARVSVRGRLITEAGEAVGNGRVVSSSDSTLTADADRRGTFVLRGMQQRTEQLYFRAVGYVPSWIEIVATDTVLDIGDVVLRPIPQQLATMMIVAEERTRERREFEERRTVGLGTYLDEEEVAKYPRVTPAVLRSLVNSGRLVEAGPGLPQLFVFTKGMGVCYPIWYVDGWRVRGMDSAEMYGMLGFATRVEVYKATFAPARFVDFNGCGSVVVWTR